MLHSHGTAPALEEMRLGKHCADALIPGPQVMWSKTVKYVLNNVSTLIKAGWVILLGPTGCWTKVSSK